MASHNIKITIEGKQGHGKTHVLRIIVDALRDSGYSHVKLLSTPWSENRLMIFDDFHTIEMEEIQLRKEVKNDQ